MEARGKRRLIFASLLLVCSLATLSSAVDSDLVQRFNEALTKDAAMAMTAIIKEQRAEVPEAVGSILDEALLPETAKEEREGLFYLAERMARVYLEVTGDVRLLKGAKQRIFESKLPPQVRPEGDNGVHTVEATSTAEVKNLFLPANIVIKKGEVVRWVNSDKVEHLVGSVPFIGRGGIMTPRVKPGESQEHRFEEAGEYYYVCFIHRVMYGKVTVEE
ncbi:MAG: plastocyanin/azurin family copper-binding protein [Thermodesulfobacteriota bacterium]